MRQPRWLNRIGPLVRSPTAWSTARPTAGRQRYQDGLVAFTVHTQDPMAVSFTEVSDVDPAGLRRNSSMWTLPT
jgi:hypothetical protein